MLHAPAAAPPAPPPAAAPAAFRPQPAADARAALFSTLLSRDALVDEAQLRRAGAAGVPPFHRPLVWRLLLGITAFDDVVGAAAERERARHYASLAAEVDADDDVARRIRAVLKRSRNAYQPLCTHEKKPGRQGSTSGDSYDGDEEDDQSPPVQEPSLGNGPSKANGRAISYVRNSRSAKVRIVDREIVDRFTRVINTFMQCTGVSVEFHPDMVHICAPFIELMPAEADAFFSFKALMKRHQRFFRDEELQEAVSEFITMFRTLHHDLYEHFVAEEVDMNTWVPKWLRCLLVQQLPRRSLLRLWDAYFANSGCNGLDLHPYVCLVFIEHIKPELQDCDDGERILSLLGKLPAVDIDRVIAHAIATREQLSERGIL